jgi:hypothetical protein
MRNWWVPHEAGCNRRGWLKGDSARGHEAQDDLGARLGPPSGRGTRIYKARRRRLGTGALGRALPLLYPGSTVILMR